jgi:DNA-binding transcriptional LysR family regulator
MAINLPTELLRSFTAIVDTGSMARATEQMFVTQSALSLQMKRLEGIIQTPLFHRDGRRLILTNAGRSMLVHAREILAANDRAVSSLSGEVMKGPARVGLVQDFAEGTLSGVLASFAAQNPQTPLQVRVGSAEELLELIASDRLDIALCTGLAGDTAAIRTEPMIWLGDGKLRDKDILPLAVLEQPCQFRQAAIAALEKANRPYRIILETPNLSVLRAAVQSGQGVTCRTALFTAEPIAVSFANPLPSLPQVTYTYHVRNHAQVAIQRLADLVLAETLKL